MRKVLLAVVILIVAIFIYKKSSSKPESSRSAVIDSTRPQVKAKLHAEPVEPSVIKEQEVVQAAMIDEPKVVTERDPKHNKPVLPFKMENGLMVVQGDIVVGVPTREDVPSTGLVEMPQLKLWPHGLVPFHIQPSVHNPERILQAVALFENTAVHLVPYSNEDEVLVFEQGPEACKSYVGKMGGKQPIWISDDCAPPDIAHEILHALGLVHEQNRTDRDKYVDVHFENIDERFKDNFEKLPSEYMKVSGLGEFDYQSLMMYPPWMFAKNGQSTMEPKSRDKLIQPGTRLSPTDVDRINRAYSH